MEITITPRRIVLALAVLALLAAGGLVLSRREGGLPLLPAEDTPTPPPSATPDPLSDEAARGVVEQAITAFFTADYADPAGWLKQFEPFTLDTTVDLFREVYQPRLWPDLQRERIVSTASVVEAERLVDGFDEIMGVRWQLWRYSVRVEPGWPGFGSEVQGYLTVVERNGRWWFDLFVDEQTAQEMLLARPTIEAAATAAVATEEAP